VCTRARDRHKKEGRRRTKERNCHTQETKPRRSHTQSRSSPRTPPGDARLVPKKQSTLHVHTTQTAIHTCYIHRAALRWRRHRCCEHRPWCARISGEKGGRGVVSVKIKVQSRSQVYKENRTWRISEDSADGGCGPGHRQAHRLRGKLSRADKRRGVVKMGSNSCAYAW